jgi:hypothetical protein
MSARIQEQTTKKQKKKKYSLEVFGVPFCG